VSTSESVATLSIRVDSDTEYGFTSVRLLVDGEDVLATAPRDEFMGYEPKQVLVDGCPLLPVTPPRRVGLYRCSCNFGGCGNVTAIVIEDGDRIRWTDFRDYEGHFDDPIEEEPSPDWPHWQSINRPDIVFDGRQYREEVARALAASAEHA